MGKSQADFSSQQRIRPACANYCKIQKAQVNMSRLSLIGAYTVFEQCDEKMCLRPLTGQKS